MIYFLLGMLIALPEFVGFQERRLRRVERDLRWSQQQSHSHHPDGRVMCS